MGRCSGKGRSGHVAPKTTYIKQGDLKNKVEEAKKAKLAKKEAWAASGQQVESPIGLPAGWVAEKFVHESGLKKGKPYLRFRSLDGKHKELCTVSKAIKMHAADNGLDEKALLEDYEKRRNAAQAAKPKVHESEEKAVEAFRAKYGGPLDRATIAHLPGWSLDSRSTGNSDQVMTTYRSPTGEVFLGTRQVEVLLGKDVLSGKGVAGVVEAREKGKAAPPSFKGRTSAKKVRQHKPRKERIALKKKRAGDMEVDAGKPSLVKKTINKKKNSKAKLTKK